MSELGIDCKELLNRLSLDGWGRLSEEVNDLSNLFDCCWIVSIILAGIEALVRTELTRSLHLDSRSFVSLRDSMKMLFLLPCVSSLMSFVISQYISKPVQEFHSCIPRVILPMISDFPNNY